MKHNFIFIAITFLIGCAVGFGVSESTNALKIKGLFYGYIANTLDRDIVLLHNGDVWTGNIISKEDDQILLRIDNGITSISRSEIKTIDENYYTRHLKRLW